jgi:hypothetical protein
MSGDDFQPDPPDHLLRWDENLAEHVDVFPPQTQPGEASFDTLKNILRTIAQWYVRKDGKYYDVEEFGPVFSRDDVERIIVQRLKGEFPGKDLSEDEVRQLLQVAIRDVFVDPRRSIPMVTGASFLGGAIRSRQSRRAVVSPCRARSTAFRDKLSASPSSNAIAASVAL